MSTDARTDQWLSVSEAALELGVSSSTIRRWVHEGALPVLQPHPAGVIRVPVRALTARRKEAGRG